MTETPLLSVRLMVYNNKPYIKEALDGVLMQQTNFPFEVVIGDDFSTDGTLEILHEYKAKYPEIIRILDRPIGGEYQLKRKELGRLHNFIDIVNNCHGKYIAILDGDDYWTDPLKLQTQVDFLENNSNFSICYHQTSELFESGETKITNQEEPDEYDASYLLSKGWHIRSVSVVFKKSELPVWPSWIYEIESLDYATQCLLTKKGQKIRCLKKDMAIYRIHAQNVSSKLNDNYLKILLRNKKLLENIQKEISLESFKEILSNRILKNNTELFYQMRAIKKKSWEDYKEIFKLFIKLKINFI